MEAVVAADNAIKRKSREEKSVKSMGTTLVAAWLFDGYANIIWCGDSRGYLFNPVSGLAQVTKTILMYRNWLIVAVFFRSMLLTILTTILSLVASAIPRKRQIRILSVCLCRRER